MGPRDTGCWLAQLYYYMRVSLSNWIEKCNIGIDHTPIYLNTITIVSCLYAWERCNIYCYTNMSDGRRYCNKTIQCYFAPWLRLSLVTSKSLYKSSMNPYVDCFFVFSRMFPSKNDGEMPMFRSMFDGEIPMSNHFWRLYHVIPLHNSWCLDGKFPMV